jgi:CBS-domain-containing membrane protein
MKARDVMTSPIVTVSPDTPIPAAAALLDSHGFTAASVVDAGGQLVAIVSSSARPGHDDHRHPGVPEQPRRHPAEQHATRRPVAA